MSSELLIFIPTYNERDNIPEMIRRLDALELGADLLFMDDGSPDGSGALLDQAAEGRDDFHVIHRGGKLGIGSAHLDGIAWAYDQGYKRLVTLDCDFSHSPEDIWKLLAAMTDDVDTVVGSRYLEQGSLPGWNLLRRTLTHFGHWMTVNLLGMPQDATGAFRAYHLERVPERLWRRVQSRGYSFFFESLFLACRNGLSVAEVPVVLPARTYGSSKMSVIEAMRSGMRVWDLWLQTKLEPEKFSIAEPFHDQDPDLEDPQDWDDYWDAGKQRPNRVYAFLAALYRNLVLERRLRHHLEQSFEPGAKLLHAGCGSGQVDAQLGQRYRITAVDISVGALQRYQHNNPGADEVRHASVFCLPYSDHAFDGAYNLGVMEHFNRAEIQQILGELRRTVKPGGKLVLFWPHAMATSVWVLRIVRWVLRGLVRRDVRLHPDEITYIGSREGAETIFRQAGLRLEDYSFGPQDLFVQAVLVGQADSD